MEPPLRATPLCDNDACFEFADVTCQRCGNQHCHRHADHESWHTRPAS